MFVCTMPGVKRCDQLGLKPHFPYRVSRAIECPELAGKTVIYLRPLQRHFDVERAVVRVMAADGGCEGAEWFVRPDFILPV